MLTRIVMSMHESTLIICSRSSLRMFAFFQVPNLEPDSAHRPILDGKGISSAQGGS